MASIKDLKKRIQSTKNTQMTTKAMKMVSAAYLRRAQDAILNQRPYAKKLGNLLKHFLTMNELEINSPLLKKAEEVEVGVKKKLLLLVVTSDRGLCGGFNSNLIRRTQRWVNEHSSEYESIQLGFVGKKGYDFFKTKKFNIGPYFQELGGKVTFMKARKLSEALVEMFVSGQVDEVKVMYNLFQNAISQIPTVENFLPLVAPSVDEAAQSAEGVAPMVIVKPDPTEVLAALLEKHFPIQAFRILLESQAGEHGARMSAMENATKNAGEMILALTMDYNKQRQAAITKELLEIIAGSESQKAAQ